MNHVHSPPRHALLKCQALPPLQKVPGTSSYSMSSAPNESRPFHWLGPLDIRPTGLAIVSLLGFSALWLARWPTFPLFLDPYYHLFIARQVLDAGGPITYEWWEYAPVGRAHLYPPLFHLILAGLLKVGCSSVLAIRLVSALVIPAVLGSIYLVMRRLVGASAALASLWVAMAAWTWMLHLAGALVAGIALIELLWFMVAVQERRMVAAACLLALLFYTHLGLPWVALASVAWCCALKGLNRIRSLLISAGWGLLMALPWLWHMGSNLATLHVRARTENETIEILPLVCVLAAYGAWRCWKPGGSSRLLLGLWLGFCLMAYPFTFRWLSGEGLLPVILLAGYGLGDLSQRLAMRLRRPTSSWLGIVAFSGLLVVSPTAVVSGSTVSFLWPDTTPFHLLNWRQIKTKGIDVQLYGPRTERLAHMIAGVSQPGEILWSNAPHGVGLVAALAHRPSSSAMFYEVGPARPFDPIAAAQWIVWFKIEPLPGMPALADLIRRYQLRLVAEDELALVFRSPGATQLAQPPHAIISWWMAFVLSCGLLGMIVWDFRRNLAKRNFLSEGLTKQ